MSNLKTTNLYPSQLAELQQLFREVSGEIERLRRQNELYRAQLDVLETIRAAVLGPRPSQGYGPDLLFAISKFMNELENPEGKEVLG